MEDASKWNMRIAALVGTGLGAAVALFSLGVVGERASIESLGYTVAAAFVGAALVAFVAYLRNLVMQVLLIVAAGGGALAGMASRLIR